MIYLSVKIINRDNNASIQIKFKLNLIVGGITTRLLLKHFGQFFKFI